MLKLIRYKRNTDSGLLNANLFFLVVVVSSFNLALTFNGHVFFFLLFTFQ